MRILVVCGFKERLNGHIAPFVKEQMDAIRMEGMECEPFLVRGKGIAVCFGHLKALKRKITSFRPDVIHAHCGLCGLLANLQRRVPVVTTYHGSDINNPEAFRFSKMAIRLSVWNIFVSQKNIDFAHPKEHYTLLPCGVDLNDLQQTGKTEARQRMGLSMDKWYVLFSGGFDNAVKDASLAKTVVDQMEVALLELKGYSREEVTLLMCAADALLMTSISEGSPQVIKEAMACGCPIVSVDVGDVKERVEGLEGCYVAKTREPKELAELLQMALAFEGKTNGRKRIIADGLDNRRVAENLAEIYRNIIRMS